MASDNEVARHAEALRGVERRSFRLHRYFAGVLLAGLLAAGVVGTAGAHPEGSPPEQTYAPMDVEQLHDIFAHLLATAPPERQAALQALGASAHPELQALNERALAAHRRKVDLLLQDALDRPALDRARAEEIEASNRLAERIDAALVDLAALMTPEQRAQMREHVHGHAG